MAPESKKKQTEKKAPLSLTRKKNVPRNKESTHVVEAKLNEIMDGGTTGGVPETQSPAQSFQSRFSWWSVVPLVLLVIFGAILLYEHNSDFRNNTNKVLNAVGLAKLSTEATNDSAEAEPFVMKMTIVYDKDHTNMKTSLDNYIKSLETNLQNTKVDATWLDKNDDAGKALIEKLGAKFLPVFVTDANIVNHPQFQLFSPVIKENNGEFQLESEGMEYLQIPEVGDSHHIGGNPESAKVVIQEYASMTCGYCKAMNPILEKVVDTYGPQVSWVVKHYDRGGIDSLLGQAVECAADQGRIRPMIAQIYEKQTDFFTALQNADAPETAVYDVLTQAAQEAGLNSQELISCVKAETYQKKIEDDTAEGASFGIMGTPAFFINTTFLGGATEEETFMKMVDEAINQQ